MRVLAPVAQRLVADPERRDLLQGRWLGHGVHPLLTDVPLGMWMSAHALDALGGHRARPAATLLVGLGLGAAAPTAVTGLAEWADIGRRDQRVGAVHALSNLTATACYAASLSARLQGRHRAGMVRALAGGAAALVGGYLGGHLTEVRKVSSRHPAFVTDPAQ
ncbi:MAG TPA: DUF2231 domain-containing protein [Marmoricola sp.]|nr:DUF2231 domain-containing protein [Marmoricola sp.]